MVDCLHVESSSIPVPRGCPFDRVMSGGVGRHAAGPVDTGVADAASGRARGMRRRAGYRARLACDPGADHAAIAQRAALRAGRTRGRGVGPIRREDGLGLGGRGCCASLASCAVARSDLCPGRYGIIPGKDRACAGRRPVQWAGLRKDLRKDRACGKSGVPSRAGASDRPPKACPQAAPRCRGRAENAGYAGDLPEVLVSA